ncbi:MAG: KpsF/GutQ family sugar-phosphate isomerase [Paludibacteraceae bacterium]|nr:KpsF/GutQ family sugar-phosphate isomerase [Paludibacteraceae bacterium]MBR1480347.1 KpsF/GutQ family sugar-phosphate isomerase [Paludibacteraceae bacterium]
MTYAARAREIFAAEIGELERLGMSIGEEFDRVVELLYRNPGRLVVMGIGKTGIIGHKIASSLASTGTPAIFVNAAEAMHGDLGMISGTDIVMLISNSGAGSEILSVVAPLRNLGCTLIAMTGDVTSRLARECDLTLSMHVDREVCPLGLAPTTSITAANMLGDALLVCLMEKRRFRAENFAVYHPGGALGQQLLARVGSHMTTDVPRVQLTTPFRELVREMTDKHLGITMVYDGDTCRGIITDGDLRRAIQKYDDLHITAQDMMTPSYKHIHKDALLSDALQIMDRYNITTLAVTESADSTPIIGIISIHHIIDFN